MGERLVRSEPFESAALREMKTTINLTTDIGTESVEADVFGEWAAHVSPDRYTHRDGHPVRRANVVTHVPTGLRCPCVELVGISKKQAISAARHLGETVTSTFDEAARILEDAKNGTLSDESKAFAARVVDAIGQWVRKP